MANQWFRLYAEFATDPKVQVLTEALQRRYVMLLCIQCSEYYEKRPDDEVALALRITLEDWNITKQEFIKRGLLLPSGVINGWEKRQYISDIKDPTAAERQKRYREKKRNDRNASVTSRPPEADTDTDTDTDTEQNKKTTRKSSLSKLIELGVNEQVARDWLVIRKTKKSPLTDTALKQIIAESEKAKIPLPNVIEICAKENWAGFKASWEIPEQSKPNQPFNMDNFLKAVNGQ